jgi:hypothetical protein
MIRSARWIVALAATVVLVNTYATAQVENVPVGHPVYAFLKRMELKGVIAKYHDAVLPLSRREISKYIVEEIVPKSYTELTAVEAGQLRDFFQEFIFDSGPFFSMNCMPPDTLPFVQDVPLSFLESILSDQEKHLYSYSDQSLSLIVDGLARLDARRSTGNSLGGENATIAEFGGRIRGTILGSLGYYIEGTNAQFWGSRDVLYRDRHIRQAYTLGIVNARNYDFVEGYIRYDAGIVSAQVGRERIQWGNGYGDRMIMSDNVRVFDFIRADAQYKSVKYTFMHGWLLGKKSLLAYSLPTDSTALFTEPVVADKYVAAHRIEVSFPHLFDIGFQEMAIYSNRSVDLAYLNPVTLIESAQRSREERDNILWSFDVQLHPVNNLEGHAGIVLDDINFPKWGTGSWENRYAYQLGLMAVDPLVPDLTLCAEYTRVQPFTFSHGRSRENDYGSFGSILSHHIGPNADSWFFRGDYLLTYRLGCSLSVELIRKGENILDANGFLVENAGGDFLQPRRNGDPEEFEFLSGTLVRTRRIQAYLTWEMIHQFHLDLWYQNVRIENELSGTTLDHDFGLAFRVDY